MLYYITLGLELNVGENLLFKAIAQTTGRSTDRIKADVKQLGDLGKVAEASKSNQRVMFQPAKLNIRSVFDKLKEIALMTGNSVSCDDSLLDRCHANNSYQIIVNITTFR